MPDIIITPSTGKLEFVNNSAQNIRKHVFSMDDDGLSLDAPLAATSIKAPLNIINVNVDNSNTNYPFVLASGSAVTGIKTLMMDGAGGTYNPFTNIATIDISGNSATTTLASNSSQLNGQAASYYTNIPARLGYTPVNQAGDTIAGNLTVNGNFTVNGSVTAFSASNIYLSSSVLTVEDNILTLNAFSPYLRYAGIEMYDSGSGTLSQLLWDGDGDYFFLTGSSVNGKIITGPDGQTNLTSGYIPKATAGYKLGNSLIYDNGTNVAIGTTSPAQKLDVIGNIRCVPVSSAWAEGLSFSMPTTSSWGGLRWRRERANADGNHYIGYVGTDTTDDLVFGSNNAGTQIDNNIRITKAGLVGIGTSSPVAKLHVVGVISGSSFSGAGTGLTGTAASLTAGTATIANGVATGAVKSGGLEENSVITSKIADGNVTNVKLASSSVTIGSSAVSLGSTLTTIAGLTSVTSTTFVGALTGNASTATSANALNASNNYQVKNLTVSSNIALGNRNSIYSLWHGGNQDLAWKKIADITLPNALYACASFRVDVLDAEGNFGWSVNCRPMTYFVACRRSGGTYNSYDDATVSGPINDYVRAFKTSQGVYELQIRQIQDWQILIFQVELITSSGTITYATGVPSNGSTTGTAYTVVTNGYTQYLPNVSAITSSASLFSGAGTGLTGTAAGLTAGAVTNGVYTTGAQSIGGVKSFTSTMNVTGVRETMTTVAAATNVAINLNLGTIFKLTFSSTVSTFTITNTENTNVAAGNSFTLISAPDNSNAKTIAFSFVTNGAAATAVKWATFAGGTTPTATITNGKFDVFSFVYDGVNWYGFTGGLTY